MTETFIIVGAGYAGSRAADCLRREGFQGRIVLVGEEPHPPYSRPPLCKKGLVEPQPIQRLHLRHRAFYDRSRIELMTGRRVRKILRNARQVVLDDGESLEYDRLLLCTGGQARCPPIPGVDLPGVHLLRTYEDSVALAGGLQRGEHMVIVGGGYIGLEAAAVARCAGLEVTIVELGGRVMSRVTSAPTAEFFTRRHLEQGVVIRLNTAIAAISQTNQRLALVTEAGEEILADTVLLAVGNVPNFRLAAEAELECEGGIVVDEACMTSDPSIFAAGDCTRHPSVRYGRRVQLESVDNALEQARVAASSMLGRRLRHAHTPWFWSDQYDHKLQISGLADGFDEIIVRGDPTRPGFSVWYLHDHAVLCAEAVDNPSAFMQAGRWIGSRTKVDPEKLRSPLVPLEDVAEALVRARRTVVARSSAPSLPPSA